MSALRALWDFDDLDASETRFRERLERETSDAGRAEVLTQLARVHGLRGRFDECAVLLDAAETLAGSDRVVRAWIQIERGRMLNSSGDVDAARPLFEAAYAGALDAGQFFLAGDAAHMVAIAAADREGKEEWTRHGLELGEREPSQAAYWEGPLLNNLAWSYLEDGGHERALELFQRALEARERDPTNEAGIAFARYGVGVALRTLGRPDEAAAMLEPAVAWAQSAGKPDSFFHEELAEDYAAAGREADARVHAKLALALVDPDAEDERAARLRELAA